MLFIVLKKPLINISWSDFQRPALLSSAIPSSKINPIIKVIYNGIDRVETKDNAIFIPLDVK